MQSWWRHQMETFSALLALCARNSPVTGEFPSQRLVTRCFDVFFVLRLNKQSWGLCLWRHRAHYDVIVMISLTYKSSHSYFYIALRDDTMAWKRSLDVFFVLRLNKQSRGWCLWRHRAHYDVTVMISLIHKSSYSSFYIALRDDTMAWKRFPHYLPFTGEPISDRSFPSQRVSEMEYWYFLWR